MWGRLGDQINDGWDKQEIRCDKSFGNRSWVVINVIYEVDTNLINKMILIGWMFLGSCMSNWMMMMTTVLDNNQ